MNKMWLIAIACAAGLAHAGDLYRWTDAQGVLHVSDTPPPPSEVNPTRLKVDRNKISDADGTLYAPPKAESAQKQETAQNGSATANAAANADSRSNCERVRANVQLLQGSRPVADAYGKVLDDKARADMLEQSRRVAEACK